MADKEPDKEEFWKEMFVLFDKQDNNYLTLDELKKYLQAVGVLITNKELYKMLEEFDPEKKRQFSFEQIWNNFKDCKVITNDEIIEAFKAFDKNGKISKEELKYVMTNLGDKIKDEVADKLLSNFQVDDQGNLDYKAFLNKYGVNC
jgi:calmodulin